MTLPGPDTLVLYLYRQAVEGCGRLLYRYSGAYRRRLAYKRVRGIR